MTTYGLLLFLYATPIVMGGPFLLVTYFDFVRLGNAGCGIAAGTVLLLALIPLTSKAAPWTLKKRRSGAWES